MGRSRRNDTGFSLVELLVVIMVLGVITTVTIFAVRGITHDAQAAGCDTDLRAIEKAEDAHYAMHGAYASEVDLVTAGLLSDVSATHDVTLGVGGYTVTPVGDCSTTPVAPDGPVTTTWAGLPALRLGTGSTVVLLASVGNGLAGAQAIWDAGSGEPVPPTLSLYFVDTSSFTNNPLTTQLDSLVAPGPAFVLWVTTTSTVFDVNGPVMDADAYMAGITPDLCIISTVDQIGSCNSLPPEISI